MTRATSKQAQIVLVALLSALAALVLAACGEGDELDPGNSADAPDYTAMIESAPAELAALYADGSGLLPGGLDAYEKLIADLEGFPIVVNKWASWCGPCRAEFPYLQQQAAERGDEIAFLGINSNDSDDAAETFLRDHPIPYPNVSDPDEEISRELGALTYPATIFYDAGGEVVDVHQGVYATEDDLAADIERYALGG